MKGFHLKEHTKKFDITCLFDRKVSNLYTDGFRSRMLRRLKNNEIGFINVE